METTRLQETVHENTQGHSSGRLGMNSPEDAVNNRWFEEAAQAARRPSSLTGYGIAQPASTLVFGPREGDPDESFQPKCC